MCQNTKNMKITPVTDICSKDDFVKEKVLTPSSLSLVNLTPTLLCWVVLKRCRM